MCLAVPGEVLSIRDDDPLMLPARVSFGGAIREVSLAMVPDAKVGEYVLVHAGVAISKLDPSEAARVLDSLEHLGEADD